jgi:hypothetical protein
MPSYGGKSILRKNVMSSTSNPGKCIGCLDAILSCQSTITSYYTSTLYVQFGVMVSSSGAVPVMHMERFNLKKLNEAEDKKKSFRGLKQVCSI